MAFNDFDESQQGGGEGSVDFNELNKYVVETAGLQTKEVLVGYVSAICSLGVQPQADAEVIFVGTPEQEAAIIKEKPQNYFKDGYDYQTKQNCRLQCWPQKPQPAVAIAVDFPDIMVDKGQFFGESKPLPLRMWLGGQFYDGNTMVVGRPTVLKTSKDSNWKSFDKKHLFHKMAVGAKLIDSDGDFHPREIDKLLGLSFQFSAQIYFKKNKGKEYYTEVINFSSGLGRGQVSQELLTEPYVIEFFSENNEEAIKELRAHIVSTIKKATNYEGSVIQKNIEEYRGNKSSGDSDSSDDEPSNPASNDEFDEEKEESTPESSPETDDKPVDDDEPF